MPCDDVFHEKVSNTLGSLIRHSKDFWPFCQIIHGYYDVPVLGGALVEGTNEVYAHAVEALVSDWDVVQLLGLREACVLELALVTASNDSAAVLHYASPVKPLGDECCSAHDTRVT